LLITTKVSGKYLLHALDQMQSYVHHTWRRQW